MHAGHSGLHDRRCCTSKSGFRVSNLGFGGCSFDVPVIAHTCALAEGASVHWTTAHVLHAAAAAVSATEELSKGQKEILMVGFGFV